MTPVYQRTRWDCGVCAAAMLLDLPYEEVEAKVPYSCGDPLPGVAGGVYGVLGVEVLWMALRRGIAATQVLPAEVYEDASILTGAHRHAVPARDAVWTWLAGRRAWLCVDSRTDPSPGNVPKFHAVAWDGQRVVDPAELLEPTRHYAAGDRPAFYEAIVLLDLQHRSP